MGTINWNKIASQSANNTDNEFSKELVSLTSLKLSDVENFIAQSKITNEKAIKVLKIINNAKESNENKVQMISNIEKGIGFLVQIASKIV